MRVKRFTDEVIDLGHTLTVSILEMMWGVVGKKTSLLRPSWRPQKNGGGYKESTERGYTVEAVIGRSVDVTSVNFCSPACLCVCNDGDNFCACTKKAHQG